MTINRNFCTKTIEFRHMHEAVFEDGLDNRSRPFRQHIHRHELGLHIGREARVRRRAEIHCLRAAAE